MKKRFLSMLTLIAIAVQLIGCIPAAAATPDLVGADSGLSEPKILIIGNDYAPDVMSTLNNVFRAEGLTSFKMGYLQYTDRGLDGHLNAAKKDSGDYTFYKTGVKNKAWNNSTSRTLLHALQNEPWDLIYLQQSALEAGLPDSFGSLGALIDYINENKTNPNAKLGWHMTWSYAESYKTGEKYSESFVKYYQGDHLTMYNAIANTVQSVVMTHPELVSVIPAGTAIENARTSYLGDNLNRDGAHLNDIGKVIATYCWYAALTGKTLETLKFNHEAITDRTTPVITEAVNNALKNPYAVTPSEHLTTYTLSVSGGGKAELNGQRVKEAHEGATVTLNFDTTNKCAQFNGWETSNESVTIADPSNPVTTFVMPAESVYIRANNTNTCPSMRMSDVSTFGWYHNAVDYVLNNGIMSGYSRSVFGTNDTLTRAQVVQVLYNKEGKPAVTAENQFKDVPADQWFFDAVRWAADKGVVSGVGDGNFDPNGKITLEQAAVILHNYSGKPSASAELNAIGNYSSWAADALRWCVANDLLKDIPFENASDAATRAQTAQILYNYLNK